MKKEMSATIKSNAGAPNKGSTPEHFGQLELTLSAGFPSQAKPSQAKPSQAKPSQAKPSQAKPSQAKPSQAQHK
jgi:hypothetical protein